ncbi:MAG TPA: GRP family sugar transporter [Candidatus Saccharimonadales bacterium]|nr:GRP family sugar transporter [Candidatus Saccharimonadales bacterium]
MKFAGFLYLAGYILFVGVASFLQKFAMGKLSPYQINFLMTVGMIVTAVPALYFVQKNLSIPTKSLPLGLLIGILMAVGSIAYVLSLSKLPVGTAASISTLYLVVVVVLSWFFLHEDFSLLKIIGVLLTLAGAAILSVVS